MYVIHFYLFIIFKTEEEKQSYFGAVKPDALSNLTRISTISSSSSRQLPANVQFFKFHICNNIPQKMCTLRLTTVKILACRLSRRKDGRIAGHFPPHPLSNSENARKAEAAAWISGNTNVI